MDSIAQQFAGRVKVGKVNVFDHFDLAAKYGISGVPQLFVFKGSEQPIRRLAGFQDERKLTELLDGVLQA